MKKPHWKDTTSDPQPGDFALHRGGGLDPRRVSKVSGNHIWLFLLTDEPYGPLLKKNYTFERLIES